MLNMHATAQSRNPTRQPSGILSIEVAPEVWQATDDYALFRCWPGRRMVLGQIMPPARPLEVSR